MMSNDLEKPNVLVLLKNPKNEAWGPFCRALISMAKVDIFELSGAIDSQKLEKADFIFCDRPSLELIKEVSETPVSLLFFEEDKVASHDEKFSYLNLSNYEEQEIQRILAAYILPKRLTGVTALLEKGSMIYGEKLNSPINIGSCIDKLCGHLQKINGFSLSSRLLEFRQTILAPIFLSLEAMRKDGLSFTEFQVGANAKKLIVNIRFPIKSKDGNSYLNQIKESKSIHWKQIRDSADLKVAIFHSQYNELEFFFLWHSPEEENRKKNSFLWRESRRSGKREDLTKPITDYQFHIIQDIRLQSENEILDLQISKDQVDVSALPEKVVALLEKLNSDKIKSEDEIHRIREAEKAGKLKIIQLQKICQDKEVLAQNALKNIDIQAKNYKTKIMELEAQIENLRNQNKISQQIQSDSNAEKNNKSEATTKLEQSIRSLENEKTQANEKYSNEQKKFNLLEQKYNNLFKDSMKKDKEILDIKAELFKLRKEQAVAAGSESTEKTGQPSSDPASVAKIKEIEGREAKMKQDLKKALFKIESQEKNMKAQQQEFSDKIKLMEQKLQAAKSKEVELLKKIEELSASLKKASKAA